MSERNSRELKLKLLKKAIADDRESCLKKAIAEDRESKQEEFVAMQSAKIGKPVVDITSYTRAIHSYPTSLLTAPATNSNCS